MRYELPSISKYYYISDMGIPPIQGAHRQHVSGQEGIGHAPGRSGSTRSVLYLPLKRSSQSLCSVFTRLRPNP